MNDDKVILGGYRVRPNVSKEQMMGTGRKQPWCKGPQMGDRSAFFGPQITG